MPVLQNELTNIDNERNVIGDRAAMEKKTERLYRSLNRVDELDRQLMEKKVINYWIYLKWVKYIYRKVIFIGLGLTILICLALSFEKLTGAENQVNYYTWRLSKPDITDVDRHRAKMNIGGFLKNSESQSITFTQLTDVLRSPALSTDQVNEILGILIAHRCQSLAPNVFHLPSALTESLRVRNADSRDRINRALVYLGEEYDLEDETLTDWNPAETNFDDLEKKIDEWRAFWSLYDNKVNSVKCTL